MYFILIRCSGLILLSLAIIDHSRVQANDVPRNVVRSAFEATVRITAHYQGVTTVGSGVVIGEGKAFAYILTADHVVEAGRLTVDTFDREPNGTVVPTDAEVVMHYSAADLAIIRLPATTRLPTALRISKLDRVPEIHQSLVLVGCAHGNPPKVTPMEFEGKAHGEQRTRFWVTDRAPVPGQSGGPLVDSTGHLVGICSAAYGKRGLFASTREIHALLHRAGLANLVSPSDEMLKRDQSPISARRPTRPPSFVLRPPSVPHYGALGLGGEDVGDTNARSFIRISGHGIFIFSGGSTRNGYSNNIIVTDTNGSTVVQKSGNSHSVRVEINGGHARVIQVDGKGN